MPILKRIPKQAIRETFTHKGLYMGVVPVYVILDEVEDGTYVPQVPMCERNGIPVAALFIANFVWRVLTVFHPYSPPIYITGDIE